MTPDRNCLTCRSFCLGASETNMEADWGDCRLLPPVVVVVDDQPVTLYPQVDADCHCEQWKAAQ